MSDFRTLPIDFRVHTPKNSILVNLSRDIFQVISEEQNNPIVWIIKFEEDLKSSSRISSSLFSKKSRYSSMWMTFKSIRSKKPTLCYVIPYRIKSRFLSRIFIDVGGTELKTIFALNSDQEDQQNGKYSRSRSTGTPTLTTC